MSTRTLSVDICICGHMAIHHRLWVVSRTVVKDYLRGDYDPDGEKDCNHEHCNCIHFVPLEEK